MMIKNFILKPLTIKILIKVTQTNPDAKKGEAVPLVPKLW